MNRDFEICGYANVTVHVCVGGSAAVVEITSIYLKPVVSWLVVSFILSFFFLNYSLAVSVFLRVFENGFEEE